MKKRWFVTVLFALSLCLCSIPALAAVESGGVNYLWYVENGELVYNEEGVPVSYGVITPSPFVSVKNSLR